MLAVNRFVYAPLVMLSVVLAGTNALAEDAKNDAGLAKLPADARNKAPASAPTSHSKDRSPADVKNETSDPSKSNAKKGGASESSSRVVRGVIPVKAGLNPAHIRKVIAVPSPAKKTGSPKSGKPVFGKGKRVRYKKGKKQLRTKRPRIRSRRSARKRKNRSVRQRWPTKRPKVDTQIPLLGPAPYATGERLFFKLEMFGTTAGEVALVVGKTSVVGGRETQELVGFIRGSEFLNKFYPVNNRLDALVDAKTMLPLRSNFFIREKGVKSDYHTIFDHKKRFIRSMRFKKEKKLYRNFTQLTNIYKSLGSIYGVRRMDLKVGMKFNYYIWDSRKERLIRVVVVGEERVLTDAGWFDTIRLDVSAQITGGFMRNKKLKAPIRKGSLWIAKDRYRTPVKVLTPTKLGDATATLIRRVNDSSLTE